MKQIGQKKLRVMRDQDNDETLNPVFINVSDKDVTVVSSPNGASGFERNPNPTPEP